MTEARWKVDVHVERWRVFGHQSNHWKNHRGNPKRRVAYKNGPEDRWARRNLEMIVAAPWRKNEDDAKMDVERLKGEVVKMDLDCKENPEMEEHVPAPRNCT